MLNGDSRKEDYILFRHKTFGKFYAVDLEHRCLARGAIPKNDCLQAIQGAKFDVRNYLESLTQGLRPLPPLEIDNLPEKIKELYDRSDFDWSDLEAFKSFCKWFKPIFCDPSERED